MNIFVSKYQGILPSCLKRRRSRMSNIDNGKVVTVSVVVQ